jgi:Ni/Co efflux regulator RcnB
MKALISAVVLAAAVAAPVAAFAQSNQQPLTRAEVRADLVNLEQAGYDPLSDRQNYPHNIQAAEARVHAQDSGYGVQANGTSQASSHSLADEKGPRSVFFGN